jgi:plastocyanin
MDWIGNRGERQRTSRRQQPAAIVEKLEDRSLLATVTVNIVNIAFNPTPVTIHVGDTVHWTWSENNHSTTSVAGSKETWDSSVLNTGATFDHMFSLAGTFVYYCKIHGQDNGNGTASGMTGSVVVLPASTPPPSTPPPTTPPPMVSPLTATGGAIMPRAGKTFKGVVATFAEANANRKDFHASIDWGDQHSTGGKIKSLGGGRFGVMGTHRYTQAMMFMGMVSISDMSGNQATAGFMAMVQPGKKG